MAVTGEKFAQTEGLRGVAGAEKDEAPVAAAYEFEAAEDESAHENFAELGVFGDERAEGVAGEFDEIAGFDDPSANEDAAAGNHGEFSGEAASTTSMLPERMTKKGMLVSPTSKRTSSRSTCRTWP